MLFYIAGPKSGIKEDGNFYFLIYVEATLTYHLLLEHKEEMIIRKRNLNKGECSNKKMKKWQSVETPYFGDIVT